MYLYIVAFENILHIFFVKKIQFTSENFHFMSPLKVGHDFKIDKTMTEDDTNIVK